MGIARRAREIAHNARNEARVKGHAIKQDLTKYRRELIAEANVAIRGREVRRFNNDGDLQLALGFFKPQ